MYMFTRLLLLAFVLLATVLTSSAHAGNVTGGIAALAAGGTVVNKGLKAVDLAAAKVAINKLCDTTYTSTINTLFNTAAGKKAYTDLCRLNLGSVYTPSTPEPKG